MAINFPDPSASPWYNDPTTGGNGITYEYTTEGYWKAVDVTGNNAIDEGTGNALYVNKVGDNMTGNLTLGTDKITLNATDGTADFAGTIDVGSYTAFGTGAGFRVSSGGQLNINRAANNTAIQIAEVGDATPTVLIQSNGSSTFRGSLRNGVADDNVAVIGETGIYQSYRSDATSKACFQTFVATAPTTPTSQIFSNGSAEFDGNVNIGEPDAASQSVSGIYVGSSGFLRIQRQTGVGIDYRFEVLSGSTRVIGMKNDGSAEFAKSITANNGNHALGSVYFFDNNNAIDVKRRVGPAASSSGSLALYIGNARINTTTTYEIWTEPDNPANYTTTTDSEGNETQVYNGPTLDVKERLQTKAAALEAIKTAAEDASITSLADFKSAIATALANI